MDRGGKGHGHSSIEMRTLRSSGVTGAPDYTQFVPPHAREWSTAPVPFVNPYAPQPPYDPQPLQYAPQPPQQYAPQPPQQYAPQPQQYAPQPPQSHRVAWPLTSKEALAVPTVSPLRPLVPTAPLVRPEEEESVPVHHPAAYRPTSMHLHSYVARRGESGFDAATMDECDDVDLPPPRERALSIFLDHIYKRKDGAPLLAAFIIACALCAAGGVLEAVASDSIFGAELLANGVITIMLLTLAVIGLVNAARWRLAERIALYCLLLSMMISIVCTVLAVAWAVQPDVGGGGAAWAWSGFAGTLALTAALAVGVLRAVSFPFFALSA